MTEQCWGFYYLKKLHQSQSCRKVASSFWQPLLWINRVYLVRSSLPNPVTDSITELRISSLLTSHGCHPRFPQLYPTLVHSFAHLENVFHCFTHRDVCKVTIHGSLIENRIWSFKKFSMCLISPKALPADSAKTCFIKFKFLSTYKLKYLYEST